MYNSRTFSQKYQPFYRQNVIDSKIKTLRKSVRLQKINPKLFNNLYKHLLSDFDRLHKPLSESSIDYKNQNTFSNQINYVPYKHLRS